MKKVNVIGAGLAGVEACYFLLNKGYEVHLYEKRSKEMTPAHTTPYFAELVCSNSLKSNRLDNACGLLKEEMRHMNSLTMRIASETSVPSGNALSVDRDEFAKKITAVLKDFPNLVIHEEDVKEVGNEPTIIATGPLTSEPLSKWLANKIGQDSLFFFDASAPIVKKDSINMNIAYKKARYEQGDDSYINCPFSVEEYERFYDALVNAEIAKLHDFDKAYFEGCMPIEVMAKRGKETLRYGPMKPKGLQVEGREKFHAVIQLRQDNLHGDLYNIVGCLNASITRGRRIIPYDYYSKEIIDSLSKEGFLNLKRDSIASIEDVNRLRPKDVLVFMTGFGKKFLDKIALLALTRMYYHFKRRKKQETDYQNELESIKERTILLIDKLDDLNID